MNIDAWSGSEVHEIVAITDLAVTNGLNWEADHVGSLVDQFEFAAMTHGQAISNITGMAATAAALKAGNQPQPNKRGTD